MALPERSHDGNTLAGDWIRIESTASGSQLIPYGGGDALPGPCSGIRIVGTGTIIAVSRGGKEMPWDKAADGPIFPGRAVGVKTTGTTATEFYALY